MYTAWMTNWLDPEQLPVRICLFLLTVAGLFFSVSLPHAFAEQGLVFAGAYASMQVGRTLFTLWAVHHDDSAPLTRTYRRILCGWCCRPRCGSSAVSQIRPPGSHGGDWRSVWRCSDRGCGTGCPGSAWPRPRIGTSMAAKIVLVHPDHASAAAFIAILGGPACYLTGVAWFKWVTNDRKTRLRSATPPTTSTHNGPLMCRPHRIRRAAGQCSSRS